MRNAGTNCTDNGTRAGLGKFLRAASSRPSEALHYEFMVDYKVGMSCPHTQAMQGVAFPGRAKRPSLQGAPHGCMAPCT